MHWTTLSQGGRSAFFLACVGQTHTNYTGLPGVSRHDLQFFYFVIICKDLGSTVNLYPEEQERQRSLTEVPAGFLGSGRYLVS